jgi:putative colanic acid biosynthesis glycosyltransferase
MTNPLFSIITITLNNLDGLERTQASIQSQSAKNYEWIIIDGGSTDGTADLLSHSTATYISEPDNGLYDAMNKGIERATGVYLLFMNAGDAFASSNTLETFTQHIKESRPDFIYGDALEILDDIEIYKHARDHIFASKGMFTHHQSMVYKGGCVDDLRYDLKYKIAADYDFTLKFLETAKEILHIPTPLCIFESGGISQTSALKGRIEQFKIRHHLKTKLLDNIKTFTLQSVVYFLRRISPRFYWWCKELETRL